MFVSGKFDVEKNGELEGSSQIAYLATAPHVRLEGSMPLILLPFIPLIFLARGIGNHNNMKQAKWT